LIFDAGRPNADEYVVYLANRIDEQEQLIQACMQAINNLDGRLMIAERVLATLQHRMAGEDYDEKKQTWWN